MHLDIAEPSIGNKASAFPTDRTPIGTCIIDSERMYRGEYDSTLHAISFLRECLDGQFLVALPPSFVIANHFDLRADIIGDIFLVSSVVVKGDAMRRQRLETHANVYFGLTGHAYM